MTASVKQLQANRQNAMLSTGAQSPKGKSRVAGNALKHGILSQKLLLEHECAQDFRALMDALQSDLRPVGTVEHLLVERIALAIWRQRRLVRAEAAMIQQEYQPHNFQTRVSCELPSAIHYRFSADWMTPPDDDQIQYCKDLLAEIDSHDDPRALLDNPWSLLS